MAEEKDVVKLNCPISGNPKPIIEWYQDDQLIHPMRDRFRTSRKSLKIKGLNVNLVGLENLVSKLDEDDASSRLPTKLCNSMEEIDISR